MTTLNEFFLKNIDISQFELEKLSQSVHKTFIEHDPSLQSCRTVCGITIGPDGKPVYTCRIECDW